MRDNQDQLSVDRRQRAKSNVDLSVVQNAPVAPSLAAEPSGKQVNWTRVCQKLRAELGEDVFGHWFARVVLEDANDQVIVLSVPTRFLKQWLESHYIERLLTHWQDEFSTILKIEIIVRGAVRIVAKPKPEQAAENAPSKIAGTAFGASANAMDAPLTEQSDDRLGGSPLEPRCTFETFCKSSSNSVALAAAENIAKALPGQAAAFNPLYIHSSVGLGKTHLLQAIASHVRSVRPQRRVLYLTAEAFMYRFVSALKAETAIDFKEKLRGIDLLLIDDLQFLQGKSIQQEFCHMLNALIDGARQVVVAADRPPAALGSLDERVRSRLKGGVAFEIGVPDIELRRAILANRLQAAERNFPGLEISPQVLEFVAKSIETNCRDLEGAFNRLVAHHQYSDVPVTLDKAAAILKDLIADKEPRKIMIEDIQKVVARHFNVSRDELLSVRRNRSIVRPRQVAMYLAKTMTPRSLPEIGRRFGGRDHTTVLHAVRKVEELVAQDAGFLDEVELLRQLVTE